MRIEVRDLGYIYSDRSLIASIMKTHQYSTTCSPTFIQVGVAESMESSLTKKQVQEMTKQLLGLSAVPKPDDTADALALALCHAHASGSAFQKIGI